MVCRNTMAALKKHHKILFRFLQKFFFEIVNSTGKMSKEDSGKDKFGEVVSRIKRVHSSLDRVGFDINSLKYRMKMSPISSPIAEHRNRSKSMELSVGISAPGAPRLGGKSRTSSSSSLRRRSASELPISKLPSPSTHDSGEASRNTAGREVSNTPVAIRPRPKAVTQKRSIEQKEVTMSEPIYKEDCVRSSVRERVQDVQAHRRGTLLNVTQQKISQSSPPLHETDCAINDAKSRQASLQTRRKSRNRFLEERQSPNGITITRNKMEEAVVEGHQISECSEVKRAVPKTYTETPSHKDLTLSSENQSSYQINQTGDRHMSSSSASTSINDDASRSSIPPKQSTSSPRFSTRDCSTSVKSRSRLPYSPSRVRRSPALLQNPRGETSSSNRDSAYRVTEKSSVSDKNNSPSKHSHQASSSPSSKTPQASPRRIASPSKIPSQFKRTSSHTKKMYTSLNSSLPSTRHPQSVLMSTPPDIPFSSNASSTQRRSEENSELTKSLNQCQFSASQPDRISHSSSSGIWSDASSDVQTEGMGPIETDYKAPPLQYQRSMGIMRLEETIKRKSPLIASSYKHCESKQSVSTESKVNDNVDEIQTRKPNNVANRHEDEETSCIEMDEVDESMFIDSDRLVVISKCSTSSTSHHHSLQTPSPKPRIIFSENTSMDNRKSRNEHLRSEIAMPVNNTSPLVVALKTQQEETNNDKSCGEEGSLVKKTIASPRKHRLQYEPNGQVEMDSAVSDVCEVTLSESNWKEEIPEADSSLSVADNGAKAEVACLQPHGKVEREPLLEKLSSKDYSYNETEGEKDLTTRESTSSAFPEIVKTSGGITLNVYDKHLMRISKESENRWREIEEKVCKSSFSHASSWRWTHRGDAEEVSFKLKNEAASKKSVLSEQDSITSPSGHFRTLSGASTPASVTSLEVSRFLDNKAFADRRKLQANPSPKPRCKPAPCSPNIKKLVSKFEDIIETPLSQDIDSGLGLDNERSSNERLSQSDGMTSQRTECSSVQERSPVDKGSSFNGSPDSVGKDSIEHASYPWGNSLKMKPRFPSFFPTPRRDSDCESFRSCSSENSDFDSPRDYYDDFQNSDVTEALPIDRAYNPKPSDVISGNSRPITALASLNKRHKTSESAADNALVCANSSSQSSDILQVCLHFLKSLLCITPTPSGLHCALNKVADRCNQLLDLFLQEVSNHQEFMETNEKKSDVDSCYADILGRKALEPRPDSLVRLVRSCRQSSGPPRASSGRRLVRHLARFACRAVYNTAVMVASVTLLWLCCSETSVDDFFFHTELYLNDVITFTRAPGFRSIH